jgi:hypothetical protein
LELETNFQNQNGFKMKPMMNDDDDDDDDDDDA